MKININNTRFLNTEKDLKHKDIVTLLDGGSWEESTRFKKKDGTPSNSFKINIKLSNDEIRQATLNWTNVKLLVKAFGDESDNWISKEVRAWKTKSERAKAGFVFIFVPIDWTKDDIGEWKNEKGEIVDVDMNTQQTDSQEIPDDIDTIEYPSEDIDPADIPFN